jgi:hypothetical protein
MTKFCAPLWRPLLGVLALVFVHAHAHAQSVAVAADPALAGLQRATVFIEVNRPDGDATGSGVIVQSNGIVVTAAHVLRNATRATIKVPNGEKYRIEGVLYVDEDLDVAVVKIEADSLPVAKIRATDDVAVGTRLFAIGSPLGLEGTVSDGLLSAFRNDDGIRLMQVSIPVSPGSSGGPVAASSGEIVGIVVSGIRGGGAQNLNFVLPARYFRNRVGSESVSQIKALADIRWARKERDAQASPRTSVGDGNGSMAPLPRVNDSLILNTAAVDGLTYLTAQDEGGYTTFTTTRYGVTRSVDGRTIINRTESIRVVKRGGMLSPATVAAEVTDEQQWTLGGPNAFSGLMRERDFQNRTDGTLTISGRDEVLSVKPEGSMDANRRTVRRIPNGVVPPTFSVFTITGWKGALPDTIEYWIVALDKPDPVLVQFVKQRSATAKLPLAPAGAKYTFDSRPKMVAAEVIVGQYKFGGSRSERMFLAKEPHVPIIPGATCIEMPRQ